MMINPDSIRLSTDITLLRPQLFYKSWVLEKNKQGSVPVLFFDKIVC